MRTGGDYLYSVSVRTPGLWRWSLTTHQWEQVRSYPHLAGNDFFGALYAASGDSMYGSENVSGEIWRFPVSGADPQLVADGPASDQNDGARCALAADPTGFEITPTPV